LRARVTKKAPDYRTLSDPVVFAEQGSSLNSRRQPKLKTQALNRQCGQRFSARDDRLYRTTITTLLCLLFIGVGLPLGDNAKAQSLNGLFPRGSSAGGELIQAATDSSLERYRLRIIWGGGPSAAWQG